MGVGPPIQAVFAVVSDHKRGLDTDTDGLTDAYAADIYQWSDYYPGACPGVPGGCSCPGATAAPGGTGMGFRGRKPMMRYTAQKTPSPLSTGCMTPASGGF